MFAIIISEKGGAERKESFDKNEINVGRVQGNDLTLPKGNVSKHHARLLYRDGRFIVTDLKSTNGTYVNGRKIAQATIVREGDKIYIGDFVLRLDTAATSAEAPAAEGSSNDEGRAMARTGPNPGPVAAVATRAGGSGVPQARALPTNAPDAPSYPPEREGEDGSETAAHQAIPKAPAAPRIPTAVSPPAGMQPSPSQRLSQAPTRGLTSASNAPPPVARNQIPLSVPPPAAISSPAARVPARETPAQAGRRLALVTLVDRVNDATDLSQMKASPVVDDALSHRVDRTVREQATAMKDEGEVPEGTDLDQLVRDAIRELVGLGPIGPLLEDDEVTEIHCLRYDHVLATRGGVVSPADSSFTSEEAMVRVLYRIVHQTGEPHREGENTLERRLSRGAHMIALLPPASSSHALVIRKKRRLDMSLEDFVRLGGLSRAMATFLDNCMAARANILVCGSNSGTVAAFVAALASASPPGDRVAVLQEVEEFAVPHAHLVSLGLPDTRARGEDAVRAAAKMRPDRMIVGSLAANVAAATLEVIAEGAEGVLAATAAPSLRQGLSRLVAQVLLARPGMSVEAARECVGEAFDIAVEVAPLADGRNRVVRMAELGGTDAKGVVSRDLFTAGDSGDGSYSATGVVPRVVGEFAQRGVKVDPNLFKRSVGRS
jgi:pilus assembly protein CpaF